MVDPDSAETVDDTPEVRLGAELRRLRVRAGLSLRALGDELHRGYSTISDFERGRRLPGVEVVEQYEDYFGLARGTLGAQRERARAAALESPPDGSVDQQLGDVICPYKGLRAFESGDAALFYGRETQIEGVLGRLGEVRFVAVVGASGSGKSSFVRAGLLPGLKAASDGVASANVALLTPGEHPVDELAGAVSAASGGVGVRAEELRANPRALELAAQHVGSGGLVIVVDQFEELFTLCDDEAERRLFVDALISAWRDPTSPVVVIVALRADFYGRVAAFPELAAAVVAHQTLIGPMSIVDLRRAIELPAANSGLLLQPGLVETILEDLAGEPGALPLLSHALLETCKRRRRLMLTVGGYRETGGVRGAIAQTAERTLQSLPEADRAVARMIFLSLTDVSEGAEPTRRRVDRAELAAHAPSGRSLDGVLGILADARLISLEQDSVVVAHEALIRHWPRLRGWIDADRAGLLIHRRLTVAAREWEALKREGAALYRGARLTTAREWASEHPERLSPLERDFLTASHAAEQRELEAARRRTRRLRALASGLAALTVIVATLAVLAREQRNSAQNERAAAQRQSVKATSLALSASSVEPLRTRPDVSLALAFEAYRQSPRPEAHAAVTQALLTARRSGLRGVLAARDSLALADIAFSPDGEILASAGLDKTVRLWNFAMRKQLGRLSGHSALVSAVAFSPDGKTLASASFDKTVRLWDVATGKQLARLSGHTAPLYAVAFSRDGKTIASGGEDKAVRLWDRSSGKQLASLSGHTKQVWDVAFSPDAKTLASAGDDDTVRLWDVAARKADGRLSGHSAPVLAVAFSPDGKTLASASWDKTVRLWDRATHKQLGRLSGHTDLVEAVAFSRDGKKLASAGSDETVRLWDRATRKQLARFSGHTGVVSTVAFSRDANTLASAGNDRTVRLWDPAARKQQGRLRHTGTVWGVAFSRDGKTIASAGENSKVRLWDSATGKQLGRFSGHAVALTPDGKTVVSAGLTTVGLWDRATGKQLGRLSGHTDFVWGVALSPDGKTVASASVDKTVRLWDLVTRKPLGRLSGHSNFVFGVAFSPDGKTLASAGADRTVRLWDLVTRKPRGRLSGHTSAVFGVAFSPDGKTIASASHDKTVRLWNPTTGKQLARLSGHTELVRGVAFSPDGKTLASASDDKTVRLWNPTTGKQLARLSGHTDEVFGVAFSPDGKTLASASTDKTVRLWNEILWRSTAELHTTVCDILLTSLSRTDWAQYAPGIPYHRSCP